MNRLGGRSTLARLFLLVTFVAVLGSSAYASGSTGASGRRHSQTRTAGHQKHTVLRFAAASGKHGANHFVLRRTGANLQLLDTDTGVLLRSMAFARTSAVSISGADGRVDNTLTLDFSGGSLAVPGGIAYRGGRGGYNVLALRGGHFKNEREVAHSPHSGLIVLGHTTIHYAEIAPINDTAPAASATYNGTAAAETINVVNGPIVGVQTTQVNSSTSSFELVNFANKTNVTINGNGGGDTFNLNSTTPAAGLTSLAVDASVGAASSTFNVLAMPSSVSVSLVGGGPDTANIGTGSAESITSPVSISDPTSRVAVDVNNSAGASSRFVTLSSNAGGSVDTISGMTASTITAVAGDLAGLTLSGGSSGNTFVISGTSAFLPVTLNTGTGVDSTFVQNTAPGSSVAIHGQKGSDGVAVSNAGTVQGLLGPVSIDNKLSFTDVVVDDSNDTTARAASLTTDGTTDAIAGLAPSTIALKAGDLHNFTLDGGSGGNTFTLAGLGAAGTTTFNTGTGADTTNVQPTSSLGPLNINGEAGNDTVRLGGTGSTGSVQNLVGAVAVTNPASTALTINDSGDTTARSVAVGTTAVTGLAPAQINYTGVPALTIDGGAPSDTFAVTPSQTTTDTLVGGGPVSATPPGNTLNMTLTGTSSPALTGTSSAAGAQGAWTFANRKPVNFSAMQSLNPTALSVADAATTVGGSGSSPLSFVATLLAPSATAVSASYATADGTATAASGAYQPASGTVSFPSGTTSQTISVTALGRQAVNPPQTLTLALTGPANAILDRAVGTGTITNTFIPAPPSISIITPADGASYRRGQVVKASYTCLDGLNAPGIKTCAGPVANGAGIAAGTAGAHSFTVTATSNDGLTTSKTVHYTVTVAPHSRIVRLGGSIAAAKLKLFQGTSVGASSPVARVAIALERIAGGAVVSKAKAKPQCSALAASGAMVSVKPTGRRCSALRFLKASGTTRWTFRLKQPLPPGKYVLTSRATDKAGRVEGSFSANAGNRVSFTVR